MTAWLMRRLLRWLGAFEVTDEKIAAMEAAIHEEALRMGLVTEEEVIADGPA